MTDTSDDQTDQVGVPRANERAAVLSAIALVERTAAGPCPSLEDIAAWYDGKLGGQLGATVESHIARCEHCHAVWSGLLDAADLLEEATEPATTRAKTTPFAWLRGTRRVLMGGGLAGALVGVVVFLVFLPSLVEPPSQDDTARPMPPVEQQKPVQASGEPSHSVDLDAVIEDGYTLFAENVPVESITEQWRWQQGDVVLRWRGAEPPDPNTEPALQQDEAAEAALAKTAFRVGVRSGLVRLFSDRLFWRDVMESLPKQPPACAEDPTPGTCERTVRTFRITGEWAVLLHFACEASLGEAGAEKTAPALGEEFWDIQSTLMDRLGASVREHAGDSKFGKSVTDWLDAGREVEDTRGWLCGRESELLSLGL